MTDPMTRTKIRQPETCLCCGTAMPKGSKVFLVGRILIDDKFAFVCIPCGEMPEAVHEKLFREGR